MYYRRRRRGHFILALFAAPFIVIAAAGLLVWQLFLGLWFVLAVVPYRVVGGTREGIRNNRLDRVERMLEQYQATKTA